jgi:glyoxylase-like metal-dependent hydrolase (beta-lactamase superfamily II)
MIRVERVADAPQVSRLRMARAFLGRPYYFTAAYWVDGLLVDTGCAHTATQFTAALGSWQVEQVVNTHCHEDHIGANADVHERFGCPILAHPDALPILQDPKLQPLQPYRRLFWGRPRPSCGTTISEWLETEHYRFQVIDTPGHSIDHLCLFEPEQGWLFSGDAYIGGRDRALRQGNDIHGIIASLKKLAALPVRLIFSGSGTVRADGRKHLQNKVTYLEELGQRIRQLGAKGLSARRIRRQVLGRELPIAYFTLGHFSGLRLVRAYLAEPSLPGRAEMPASRAKDQETDEPVTPDQAGGSTRLVTSSKRTVT